ncbi:MAG: ATP-binding protein, partial [Allosphingosinicella sp.]
MADASNEKLPPWADSVLSRDLSRIAAAGESQEVEFKVTFPSHVGDLGKEIAAFATSNDGTIYLGIADDGAIVGIASGSDTGVRAKLRQRIEGLCSGPVQPTVTPSIRFAVHAGLTVMAIDVRKGSAPIYYAGNVPYLRQLTA